MKPPIPDSVCDRDSRKHATHDLSTALTPERLRAVTQKNHRLPRPSEDGHAQAPEATFQNSETPDGSLRTCRNRVSDSERDALYNSFQPLVHRLVSRFGDDPELREELKAEIYCRFCALLHDYDRSRNIPLRPYLVCQLTSSVYTFARQQRTRKQRELPLEVEMDYLGSALPLDPSDQWDDSIVLREMCGHLPRMMQRLTQRQRQVVRWRYYEERSYEDIAGRLEVQPSTARSILRHGLHNMRRMLEEDGYSAVSD